MKSLKTLLLTGSLLLAAAPAVMAAPHGGPGGPGGPGGMHGRGGFEPMHLMHMLEDVGATEAQRKQIETIFKSAREELKAQAQQGGAQRQQMLTLWAAPNIDAAAMDALRKQQLAQHERVSARMQQAMIEAGRVLSPEQRAKIVERMNKRMERMKKKMSERRDR